MPALLEQQENAKYGDLIRTLVPVSDLSPQLQAKLISLASIMTFDKKEFVFKQGDMDEYAYYLLDGRIELLSNNNVQSTIDSGTDSARYALARLQPRQFSAKAKTNIVILELERSTLDRLLVMDQQGKGQGAENGGAEMEVSHISEEDSGDWMTRMLQSELFARLPTANIQKLFALLEPVEFKSGDTVINQGDSGDYYYIIQAGRCEVIRTPVPGGKFVKLAELHAGDSFGEEALLTNATRNATIRMLTDGILMRISKDNFINLIKKPTLNEITYAEAIKLVGANTASWLDVRFQNEYSESRIEGSLHIPLSILRTQTEKLQKDRRYIIYCDTGGRSSAAAFLLTNLGFNVSYLKGGLSAVPQDALEKKSSQKSPQEADTAPPLSVPSAQKKENNNELKELEPGIRMTALETSLAVTSMALEKAKTANDGQAEARKRLEKEKKKLETEKKNVEKEAQKLQEQEETRHNKLNEEAARRLAKEKNKLEQVYSSNTQEMEKLQRMKEIAEQQIRKQREKLEKETELAKKNLEEARKKLEEAAAKQRAEQEAMERALQARAKASIEENRRTLAHEVAKVSEELERARNEKAQSEAARDAAVEEAQKIIGEYKKQFEQERSLERARLEQERKKLEEESKKIQDTLKDIEKTRREAEEVRAQARAEAQKLRDELERQDAGQDRESQRLVAEQIKQVEVKVKQAEENLVSAQSAENKAKVARVLNAQELQKHKDEEERMRKQIEADLQEFESMQDEQAPSEEDVMTHADHLKRIRERAEAARKKFEESNQSLLEDIEAQLASGKQNP